MKEILNGEVDFGSVYRFDPTYKPIDPIKSSINYNPSPERKKDYRNYNFDQFIKKIKESKFVERKKKLRRKEEEVKRQIRMERAMEEKQVRERENVLKQRREELQQSELGG